MKSPDWSIDYEHQGDLGVKPHANDADLREFFVTGFDGEASAYAILDDGEDGYSLECMGEKDRRHLKYEIPARDHEPYAYYLAGEREQTGYTRLASGTEDERRLLQVPADQVFSPQETFEIALSVMKVLRPPARIRLVPVEGPRGPWPKRGAWPTPKHAAQGEPDFTADFPTPPARSGEGATRTWRSAAEDWTFEVRVEPLRGAQDAIALADAMIPADRMAQRLAWPSQWGTLAQLTYSRDGIDHAHRVVVHGGQSFVATMMGTPHALYKAHANDHLESLRPGPA